MLEEPHTLTAFERDALHLDFGMFVASRARSLHVESSTIIELLTGVAPIPPKAEKAAPRERRSQSSLAGGGAVASPATSSRDAGKPTKALHSFVAPRGEQVERTAKRNDVAELHAREPWLTPDEAAQRVFIPVANLRIFTSELEIEWGQKTPTSPIAVPLEVQSLPSLRQKVHAMHAMHPTWTAALIADALGAKPNTVGVYLHEARQTVAA